MIIQALSHSIRRDILRLVRDAPKTYTEISDHFDVSRGKLNYHLSQLTGFLEKNEQGLYLVTGLGEKALEVLEGIKEKITGKEQPMIKQAYVSQQSKKDSILQRGVNVWIGAVIFAITIHVVIAYFALTDPQTPWVVYVILAAIFALEIYLLKWLFGLRVKAPEFETKVKTHLKDD